MREKCIDCEDILITVAGVKHADNLTDDPSDAWLQVSAMLSTTLIQCQPECLACVQLDPPHIRWQTGCTTEQNYQRTLAEDHIWTIVLGNYKTL